MEYLYVVRWRPRDESQDASFSVFGGENAEKDLGETIATVLDTASYDVDIKEVSSNEVARLVFA